MFRSTIVSPGHCLLEQVPGRATRVLEAGKHSRHRDGSYVPVDLRQRLDPVAPQDVPTSDGVSVKLSATIRWSITNPVVFVEQVADPFAQVYLAVQVALRDALADSTAEDAVATARRTLGPVLTAAATGAGETVGIAVHEVVVRDVLLPADLRAAYAELVTGRHKAQAQLDAARAETAALRSLANAAKLLDDHPALAKLRLVQALPYGSTLELSVDGASEGGRV